MTDLERRLNEEFSNEFDIFYNNITSNQTPGLDAYEKSVLLTRGQSDIVKAYFNPKTNKVQEGFDGSERRLIDFSMITRSKRYSDITYEKPKVSKSQDTSTFSLEGGTPIVPISSVFKDSFFDLRDNTKSIELDSDILMITNEYVEVMREGNKVRLTIIPITYTDYSKLMRKSYKWPLKNQAWRLLDSVDGKKMAEIIIGPNDELTSYNIRYVKRPRAIRLIDFDDVTIEGGSEAQCCELDPILYPEIILRACELGKAIYAGDLLSLLVLGLTSQTGLGIVTQDR